MTPFPPSTYGTCDGCGIRAVGLVTHSVQVGPFSPGGQKVWKQWGSCTTCNSADEARWAEQRADEDRERAEAQARAKRAEERVERQRAAGQQRTA